MARVIGKLTTLAIGRAKKKGLYGDGGGLYLQVSPTGSKSWLFRFLLNGKAHAMGLGPLHTVTLAEARVKATDCRKLLVAGFDPLNAKKDRQVQARLAATKGTTFEACAKAYIEAHKASWKSEVYTVKYGQTLEKYAYPIIGRLPVQSIDTTLVMKVLEPVWQKKTATAKKIRSRIECVLDWAKVREYRQGENPARWRGHLENLLAKPSKLVRIKHRAALPYAKINGFLQSLEGRDGIGVQALKLLIFTACRSNEVLGAAWDEIDFENRVWTIPAERMKAGKEHRVPLTAPALAVLKERKRESQKLGENEEPNPYVFLNPQDKKPCSGEVMATLLKRMKRQDITVHGFRSTFRDWAAEQTSFPREVAEAALAHTVGNQVEAAYRRSDLFEKRRLMMEQWARYCQKPQAEAENKVLEMKPKKH
ncbi:MAG: tyrosine-type recombinase/integrase [Alphaproteobacteria bacterium]|nr:tyrosine-type recombinase/integrase [Alphaproteobacteria bacterium]